MYSSTFHYHDELSVSATCVPSVYNYKTAPSSRDTPF